MTSLEGIRRIRAEVLGMNRRNVDLLQRYNKGPLYAVVDHKQKTKTALTAHGIPVPQTYGVCSSPAGIDELADEMDRRGDFVLKPARGAGGEGVVVIAGREGETFRTPGGRRLWRKDLTAHAADILAGAYALSQARDEALLEYRLRSAPELATYSPGGVPDIRIVVFRGVPIMAMLRLPTRASEGRANLHAGGIGVGIDIAGGRTGHAISRGQSIAVHPDTHAKLGGWIVPHWDRMLQIAGQSFEAVPLGYFGIDIVLDSTRGPIVLEMNARPGLAIQLASHKGLRPSIEEVMAMESVEKQSAETRVALGLEIARRRAQEGGQ